MKVKPIKFEEGSLYRHPDFAPPPQEDHAVVKQEPHRTPMRPNQVLRTRTEHLGESFNAAEFDDEFDGNLFDGVDVTEAHGDEIPFDTASAPIESAARAIEAARSTNGPNSVPSARTSPVRHTGPPQQPAPRTHAANGVNGQAGAPQLRPNQGPGRPPPNVPNQRQPQTPVQQPNQPRSNPNGGRMPPPTADANSASRPPAQQNQQPPPQNQPLRPSPPDAQQVPNQPRVAPQVQGTTPSTNPLPPNGRPSIGFVTSRAAELLQTADSTTSINNLPTFNPHAESPVPKEQRTPGFDNRRSAPVKREQVGAPPAPPPAAQPASSRPVAGRPSSFANPHQDVNRRIGMPGAPNYAMSPSGNRGAYKPPTFAAGTKRERAPLQDVSNTGATGNGPTNASAEGPDVKRQRVEATAPTTGVENNGPVSS
jgi:hypothetical protein